MQNENSVYNHAKKVSLMKVLELRSKEEFKNLNLDNLEISLQADEYTTAELNKFNMAYLSLKSKPEVLKDIILSNLKSELPKTKFEQNFLS